MKVSTHEYHVYIMTNKMRTVLYTGVTNDLLQRVIEHYLNRGNPKTFAGKYNCYLLLYHESFKYVNDAIAREKEIKKWPRQKKDRLIVEFNPKWESLNRELFDKWPPDNLFHRKDL
ncbi:MAG: GIY-YIG nuclease family protein [Chitinophagaceae bacterium]